MYHPTNRAIYSRRTANLHGPHAPRFPPFSWPFLQRLYTGPLFLKYNGVLRGFKSEIKFMADAFESLCHGNLYTTTLHVINSAIVKLGQLTKAEKVYRGMSGGVLPKECTPIWGSNPRLTDHRICQSLLWAPSKQSGSPTATTCAAAWSSPSCRAPAPPLPWAHAALHRLNV